MTALIATDDPVLEKIERRILDRLERGEIELPRSPETASKIIDFVNSPTASARDVLRHVRADPALAGKLLEMANSAAFAGAEHVYSLQMAVVRLGLNKVGEIAFDMTSGPKNFDKQKRSNLLRRAWKFSLATGFACEALGRFNRDLQPEPCFLTGLFHDVATPAVIEEVSHLERDGEIANQSDLRLNGILERLSGPLSLSLVRRWGVPVKATEAIRLLSAPLKERRGQPLAHALVCARALATEAGMGVAPRPVSLEDCRDFRYLGVKKDADLEPARDAVMEKMIRAGQA